MAKNIEIEFFENRTAIYSLQEQIEQLQGFEDPYVEPVKYSIEEMFKKEHVYVLIHEHLKIDTEISVFRSLADASVEALRIAEKHVSSVPNKGEIKQLHWDGVVYCLYYPIEGYVWVVRREIR